MSESQLGTSMDPCRKCGELTASRSGVCYREGCREPELPEPDAILRKHGLGDSRCKCGALPSVNDAGVWKCERCYQQPKLSDRRAEHDDIAMNGYVCTPDCPACRQSQLSDFIEAHACRDPKCGCNDPLPDDIDDGRTPVAGPESPLPTQTVVDGALAAYERVCHELKDMRAERDALLAENASLRLRLDHLTMIAVDPESGPPGPEDTIHV